MSGAAARVALVVGSLAAGGASWYAAGELKSRGSEPAISEGGTAIYGCPTLGGDPIGEVAAGDEVQLVGVTDDRWAVIRHPDNAAELAWLPLALIDTAANAGELVHISCGLAAVATATTVAATTTTVFATTTSSSTTTSTSTTTTSIASTTTVSNDVTAPTVTLTANRAFFYVPPVNSSCAGQDQLDITVVVTDPTLPLTIRSIEATWTGPAGAQTANLTPLGGTRFRLQISANGPNSGELPVTITATATDGAGNLGTGQLIVPLRAASSFGCA